MHQERLERKRNRNKIATRKAMAKKKKYLKKNMKICFVQNVKNCFFENTSKENYQFKQL